MTIYTNNQDGTDSNTSTSEDKPVEMRHVSVTTYVFKLGEKRSRLLDAAGVNMYDSEVAERSGLTGYTGIRLSVLMLI